MRQLSNLCLFVIARAWYGTPLHLWAQAWRDIRAARLAQVRKAIWELKKQGKVYEDRKGRLWSTKPKK